MHVQPDRDATTMRALEVIVEAQDILGQNTDDARRNLARYWRDGGDPDLTALDALRADPIVRAYELFTSVLGVGPVTARKWVAAGMRTLDDARADTVRPTRMQQIGLKYHTDLSARIPRAECAHIISAIDAIARPIGVIEAAGSYRRGAASSGDIDLLMSSVGESHARLAIQLQARLAARPNYVDTVVSGPERLTFLWRDDVRARSPCRQVDVLVVPAASYALALNYFTGGFVHNTWLRGVAKAQGYRLNQRELTRHGQPVAVETERDLYAILNCTWIDPANRR